MIWMFDDCPLVLATARDDQFKFSSVHTLVLFVSNVWRVRTASPTVLILERSKEQRKEPRTISVLH